MKFDHSTDKISDAVEGCDTKVMGELFDELVRNPSENLGERKSEMAEWIYDNVEDPNAIVVLAVLLQKGIEMVRIETIAEAKDKMSDAMLEELIKDAPDDVKEVLKMMMKKG